MSISTGYVNFQIDEKKNLARFKLAGARRTKAAARVYADSLRRKGKLARVQKEGNEYGVYTRG